MAMELDLGAMAQGAGDIASLGGAGVALRLVSSGFYSWLDNKRKAETEARVADEAERTKLQAATEATRKWLGKGTASLGPWIHRALVLVSCVILLSTIIIPLFKENVVIHFHLLREGGFWPFISENLRDYIVGNEKAPGAVHIAIYPFQVALCSNIMTFWLTGRARGK